MILVGSIRSGIINIARRETFLHLDRTRNVAVVGRHGHRVEVVFAATWSTPIFHAVIVSRENHGSCERDRFLCIVAADDSGLAKIRGCPLLEILGTSFVDFVGTSKENETAPIAPRIVGRAIRPLDSSNIETDRSRRSDESRLESAFPILGVDRESLRLFRGLGGSCGGHARTCLQLPCQDRKGRSKSFCILIHQNTWSFLVIDLAAVMVGISQVAVKSSQVLQIKGKASISGGMAFESRSVESSNLFA